MSVSGVQLISESPRGRTDIVEFTIAIHENLVVVTSLIFGWTLPGDEWVL